MNADEQRNAVRQLGELIGFDRVVELAQELARNTARKTLAEMVKKAARQPVPDETLRKPR